MVWRLAWRTRIVVLVCVAGLAWFGIADLTRTQGDSTVVGLLFVLAAAAVAYLTFQHIRLVLTEDEVVVHNPLRTTHVPLSDVTSVNLEHPSRLLEIRYLDGDVERSVRTVTLDRRGGLKLLRMNGRAEDALRHLQEAAAGAHPPRES